MKRTTIFIDEALERDIQAIARRRRAPVASIVREALAVYVANGRDAAMLSFVGTGASGRRDTAARHEALLWTAPHDEPRETEYVPRPRSSARRRRT